MDASKLLKGKYEAEYRLDVSEIGGRVPDFGYNAINDQNPLYRPILDERIEKTPDWPDDYEFAVCLTHDVDYVSAADARSAVRRFRKLLALRNTYPEMRIRRRAASAGLDLLKSTTRRLSRKTDPYHCYDQWLKIEREYDAESTFFFMPNRIETPHPTDHSYRYSDTVRFDGTQMSVGAMIGEIERRGWEIGLHPTWASATDSEELRRQKASLEAVTSSKIVSVRQHYLNYDVKRSSSIHESVGLKYDSSLGFNDNVGFRFGTSYPWCLWDLQSDEETDVLEIPLVIQDGAMLSRHSGLRLDVDRAFEYARMLCDRVRDVNGVVTLLWHPSTIADDRYVELYERILRYVSERDGWTTTVEEVGQWWTENNSDLASVSDRTE